MPRYHWIDRESGLEVETLRSMEDYRIPPQPGRDYEPEEGEEEKVRTWERLMPRGTAEELRREVLYSRWVDMRRRCNNPAYHAYLDYGGRGISVYPQWNREFESYYQYVRELPNADTTLSLDRIDNDGNYEPGNLRWADATTQNLNRRDQRQHINAKWGVIGLSRDSRDGSWTYCYQKNHKRYRRQAVSIETIAEFIADTILGEVQCPIITG